MILAQISDCHLLADGSLLAGQFDTAARFQALLADLARRQPRPDLILVSGDLGEAASAAEYQAFGAGLRGLGIPVLAVPGNHDARAPMRNALPDMTQDIAGGYLCARLDLGERLVIGLDTLTPGAPEGTLCDTRLEFLEDCLAETRGQRVLIVMHHPPVASGLWDMDRMGLTTGAAGFARAIAAHGGVEAILCGHLHRRIEARCAGVPVRVAPSASHGLALDLTPGAPYRFGRTAPGYLLHIWGDSGLISHDVVIGAD